MSRWSSINKMKGSFISKFSGDTTGAARCPRPTNPGATGGTLTTRLIPRCCDMFSPSEINFPVYLVTVAERAVSAIRVVAYPRRSRTSQQGDTVPLILRSNLCLRRGLRAEDALEAFAVLQEDQNPQHASDQRGRDAARCHRQVEREDVVELRSKQCQRKWHERAEEQQQPTDDLQQE